MSTAVTGFHTFTYKHGDRPLDGYTIQRAAGRGGFGEVYYALSDSGREVALKAVLGYEQIELRGISQCMNLKSPHLVTVFDVKHNDRGRPFVIMEYVAGPSLRQLLDESPGGLGTQKAAFFLREMAKGLMFLHECGIVHRDLKPANIFYENGYVKIGDYGLSKAMEPGPHSAQTITVGTVHYMAPEIGAGKYDKGIDIYALGAVLYEMLTGQVPYLGASAGEILMKHMTAEPDVTGIEEPFAAVIKKAMHRDPAKRYQNVQEMVEAVFGAEHVRNSVSCFSPEDLSMVAQRVARQVAAAHAARGAAGGSSGPAPGATGLDDGPPPSDVWDRMGGWVDRAGDRFGAVGGRLADAGARMIPGHPRRDARAEAVAAGRKGRPLDDDLGPAEIGDPLCDPLSRRQRRVIGLIVVAVVALATGLFDPFGQNEQIAAAFLTFAAAYGAAGGMLLARRKFLPQMAAEQPFIRRVIPAAVGGVGAFLTSVWVAGPAPWRVREVCGGSFLALLVPLFLNWKADTSPSRPERVTFGANLGALIVGFILAHVFDGSPALVVGTLAATALLTQILSPWDPFAARRKKGSKGRENPQWGGRAAPAAPQPGHGAAVVPPPPPPAMPAVAPMPARVPPPPPRLFHPTPALPLPAAAPARPVPVWARWWWLAAFLLAVPAGIMCLVYAGVEARHRELPPAIGFGVGLLLLGVLSFCKTFQRTSRVGWWRYAGRWLGLWACFQTAFIALLFAASGNVHNEDAMAAIFLVVFPVILMPVVAFVRFTPAGSQSASAAMSQSMNGMSQSMSSPAGPPTASGYRRRPAAAILFPAIGRLVWAAGDLALALVIAGLLGVAALVGLGLATDIPGMIAAGLPDPHLATQLNREFGFESWPGLLRHVGVLISVVTLLLAVGLLMLSRRRWGGTHMLRAICAIGVFLLALTNLSHALHGTWSSVPDRTGRPSMPASVEQYLSRAEPAGLATAGLMALVSFTLIAWPADKRRNRQKALAVTAQEAGEPRPVVPAPAAEAKPV